MKKVLFATTALVATAGIASADVSLSGYAEIGMADTGSGDMQFHSDMDVNFKLSGATDNGLSFGATIDLDEVSGGIGANGGAGTNAEAVFVSGSFGTITMGDTDGALDWAMTETAIGGTISDDETVHAGYNGNAGLDGDADGQILRYNHSVGALGFAVSMEQAGNGGAGDDITAAGVTYGTDMGGMGVALGLGTQKAGDDDLTGLSVKVTSGAYTFIANTTDGDVAGADTSHVGLGFGYTMNALTVGVNWGENEVAGVKADGFAVAVNYDLGGGAVAQFGYSDDDAGDTMSFGLGLSF